MPISHFAAAGTVGSEPQKPFDEVWDPAADRDALSQNP
jgi:hypothetical protein